MDKYSEWRRREYIRTIVLSNKEQYYIDLMNIEHSWSGRIDGNICNNFVMEAEQQLVNAIELFEQGYFDCAYYSLRSAVDISTTMVFLADMPYEERAIYIESWKSTCDFPMQGQMIKALSQSKRQTLLFTLQSSGALTGINLTTWSSLLRSSIGASRISQVR